MKFLIGWLILFCFSFVSCVEEKEKEKEKEDAQEPAAAEVFHSKTLKKADKIKGVYSSEFNFDFDLVSGMYNEVLNVFNASKSHRRLKISINHSGSDEQKQIIVAVETRLSEGLLRGSVERLCSLFDEVDYRFSENKTSKAHFFGKIRSKGGIGDAKHILALEVSDIQVSNIDCDGDKGKMCIYMGPNSYDKSLAKPLTEFTISELEPLKSFDELKKQCGF